MTYEVPHFGLIIKFLRVFFKHIAWYTKGYHVLQVMTFSWEHFIWSRSGSLLIATIPGVITVS